MANRHMKSCSMSLNININKSKPRWDATSHQSTWLKLTSQETAGVGKDAGKGEPSYAVDGNASWRIHCAKLFGGSSKSGKLNYPTTQQLPYWVFTPKIQIVTWRGHLYPSVYSSNVGNRQAVQRAQMSLDRWMDKEEAVYIRHGILCSHQKKKSCHLHRGGWTRIMPSETNQSE